LKKKISAIMNRFILLRRLLKYVKYESGNVWAPKNL
jgi:hypothetical protein